MIKDVNYALNLEKYPLNYIEFLESEKKLVIDFVKNTKNLLDLGCGNGRAINFIAPLVKNYVGVDIDKKCIDQAKKLINNYKNINLICINAEDLSQNFKENTFDKSICLWNTIACVENEEKVLKEIAKVTKDSVFLTVIAKGTLKEREEYYQKLGIDYKIDLSKETIYSKTWGRSRAYSKEEIIELCEKSGFAVSEIGNTTKLSYYLILKKVYPK